MRGGAFEVMGREGDTGGAAGVGWEMECVRTVRRSEFAARIMMGEGELEADKRPKDGTK